MRYFFEDYSFDTDRRELRRGPEVIPTTPQVFDLLDYLIGNRDRVVSKDDLVKSIWNGRAVSDAAVTTRLNAARSAIGDCGKEQRLIKTLPRKGFRFIGSVQEAQRPAVSVEPCGDTALLREWNQRQGTTSGGDTAAKPLCEIDIEAPATLRSPDRRQVTVLICDLVGTSALAARLDPEELQVLIAAYQRCSTPIISRFGGVVGKLSGTEILVYFGHPQAHEHDIECAVRAGLTLVEAVSRLGCGSAGPLQLRVGIATGPVVIGDLLGNGADQQGIIGEAAQLAGGLERIAELNTVLIAASTRQLVGNLFDCDDLGQMALNGFCEPVPAWRVLRPSGIDSRFEALRAPTTPLIGRDEELDLLLRRWRQAANGDGRVVLLSGEPGIGKSRLTVELQDRLEVGSPARLRQFCSPHHQDSPLYPIINQIQRAAGFRRDDTDEQRLDKLAAMLARATDDLSEAAPLIANLLSVPTGGRYPPLDLTPQKRKEKTLRALLAQLEGMAAREPVLVVFEDVHWIDPTSLEFLDMIVDRVPTLPVLLIITFRPEFAAPWIGRPHVTLLTLNRLPPAQRAEMIAGVTGGKALPQEIADQIIDHTDGVPLFVEELTKSVIESGLLRERDGQYILDGPLPPLAIPTSLHASLLARLDRLAPVRELAQIGAALGREFSYEQLRAVAGIPERLLREGLDQLVRSGLIFCRGEPPTATYLFKHALLRDAAHGSLLRTQRQLLHHRIASALEVQFAEVVVEQPELLAQHCSDGGLGEKAVVYWLKAGQKALAQAATAEAIGHLTKGLSQVANLPPNPELRRNEINLQIALGNALILSKGHSAPEVETAFERARSLIEQAQAMGDPPGDPLLQFAVMYGLWVIKYVSGSAAVMLDRARECLAHAESHGASSAGLIAHRLMGSSLLVLGDPCSALAHLERAVSLYEPDVHNALAMRFAQDPGVAALIGRSWALSLLGYPDQALRDGETALEMSERLAHTQSRAYALCHVAMFPELMCRRIVAAERHGRELMAIADEFGFPFWSALGMLAYGGALVQKGRGNEGIDLIRKGLTLYAATGSGTFVASVPFIGLIAEAHANEGNISDARGAIQEALATVESTGARWAEAEVHRVSGSVELRAQKPDADSAEASFARSVALSRCQSARLWELRASTSLARLWRDQGKRTEARDLLAPIYGWFTEGFDTPDLKEAKALLDELA